MGLPAGLAVVAAIFVLLPLAAIWALAFGILTAAHHGWFLMIYSGIWFVRAAAGPWLVRRERRRAEAAVLANAGG